MIRRRYRTIIGRNEPLLLTAFDTETQFPSKADTGAYRSAIHCANIKVSTRNGVKVLSGTLLKGHPCAFEKEFHFETEQFTKVKITSSFGHEEERYEIGLRCKVGTLIFNTTFTLADRSKKLFPILLGRKALRDRFFVDVAHSNIDRIYLKKHYGQLIPDSGEEDFFED